MRASYLVQDAGDPVDSVPELSRRARGVPVWAALRSLGRSGVADLVDRLAANARAIAAGIAAVPGAEVLNDVVFTQVCAAFGDDERTRAVTARLLADGVTWMSGSRWRGRDVMRVSVSNWSTDDADVAAAVDAVRRAAAGVITSRRRSAARPGTAAPAGSPGRTCAASPGVAVVASTSRPSEASQISYVGLDQRSMSGQYGVDRSACGRTEDQAWK